VSACFPDEWEASPRGVWRPIAAACLKSAWLQDGQVDRADRIYRVGEDSRPGRRRQE
jgi:hypothetical protein